MKSVKNARNAEKSSDERVLVAEQMVFDADQVTAAVAEGIEKIQHASNLEELKAIKTQYAGADSAMTQASKAIGSLPADQKKEAGKLMGKLRADFGRAFGPKEKELKEAAEQAALAAEMLDEAGDAEQGLGRAAAVAGIEGHCRTSIAERRPSDSRLNEIEVMKIATPGRAATQGWT